MPPSSHLSPTAAFPPAGTGAGPRGQGAAGLGRPGEGYTWFDQEHGIYIDHNGFLWMGTSNGHRVMKFTRDGKHVLTIGTPGVNKGSNDPDHLGGPANFCVEPKTTEIFIADGYINKRVVVYDAATGKYKLIDGTNQRVWILRRKDLDDSRPFRQAAPIQSGIQTARSSSTGTVPG